MPKLIAITYEQALVDFLKKQRDTSYRKMQWWIKAFGNNRPERYCGENEDMCNEYGSAANFYDHVITKLTDTCEMLETDAYPYHVYCSKCYATYVPNREWIMTDQFTGTGSIKPPKYCPHCGRTVNPPYEKKE